MKNDVFDNVYLRAAKQFVELNPLYYSETQLWWLWNHNLNEWQIVDETDILILVDDELAINDSVQSSKKNMILEALRRVARKNIPSQLPSHIIQIDDCLINLLNGETFVAGPEYFTTNRIPWGLGSTSETPTIDRLLHDWVGNDWLLLKEIIAYCMITDYPLHRIFCFNGSGSNGKSTCLRLIEKIIGHSNVTSTDLENLMSSRFEVSKLFKKNVCMMGETNFNTLQKTGLLKKLTGQDLISGEFKNKPSFDFRNYAKIIVATNQLPMTGDRTDGFYRRWVIIDFNKQFHEQKDVLADIPDVEFMNFCRYALDTLPLIISRGSFTGEGSIEDRRQRYDERSDPMKSFIEGYCYVHPDAEVSFNAFYVRFTRYLKDKGLRSISYKLVSHQLAEKSFSTERKNFRSDDGLYSKVTMILGLRLRSELLDFVDNASKNELNDSYGHHSPDSPHLLFSPIEKEMSRTMRGIGTIGTINDFDEKVRINSSYSYHTECVDCGLKVATELDDNGRCKLCR